MSIRQAQDKQNKPLASKTEVGISLLLSLFFVVFLWGFWSKGEYALGANFSIYLGAVILFFVSKLRKSSKYSAGDLVWIIPLFLMALSFALYENPFFKVFNLLVFPAALALFYTYSWVDNKKEVDWNLFFLIKIVRRLFSFFIFLVSSLQLLASNIFNKDESRRGMLKRVVLGLAILLFSLLVIVPVLSSADPLFAKQLKPFYDFVINILSTSIIAKIIVFAVLAIATLATLLAWGRPHTIADSKKEVTLDLVITSIVLGGIFVVYLLFLWVQFDRLWVGALPFDFNETENLVKSGFWQLLFLTFVNLAIFFLLYRKTASTGQKILGTFSVASILLLVSSAQRMGLYVTYYGFSYEKFYASYVVLFCGILFLWLVSRLFVAKKSNVFKFLALQFLWMFAVVSVFPVEQFILKSNMALVQKEGSHIRLSEMAMLSTDVLTPIKKYAEEGKLKEKVEYDWGAWIAKQENKLREKKWYELNLSAVKK